jgi:nitrite reductase/ring-hydroxylating ferredoxin subunit
VKRKFSRRDFAKTSLRGTAAAVAVSGFVKDSQTASTAAKGASAARRLRAGVPPPLFGYGGDPASMVGEFRDSIAMADVAGAARSQAPEVIRGWRSGTTIPPAYYTDVKQYLHDERYIANHFWLMADHESRIPKPGDYFVFAFGRGESVIVLRDKNNGIKAFHNVCRHRASRIARHDRDPAPQDAARLSVRQLGASGNTPVFRCPYHAWTYDLDGRLISAPNGMPSDFDFAENGLIPCHARSSGGFIFVNLSLDTF